MPRKLFALMLLSFLFVGVAHAIPVVLFTEYAHESGDGRTVSTVATFNTDPLTGSGREVVLLDEFSLMFSFRNFTQFAGFLAGEPPFSGGALTAVYVEGVFDHLESLNLGGGVQIAIRPTELFLGENISLGRDVLVHIPCCVGGDLYRLTSRTEPEPAPPHFLTYQIKRSKQAPKFERTEVSLRDQFLEGIFRVHKPVALLNPADKEGEGITDPDTHLLAYKVNEDFSLSGILVENQFGQFLVNIDGAKRLLVPASKSLSGAPLPAPISDAHNVDHFLCYQIEEEESAPRIVSVQDQFNAAPKLFEIRHPRFLCNPVDKNGEGIKNEENDLLCFRVQPVEGEPIHERVSGIFLSDQFGEHEVDTQKERELCLPSTKTP